MQKILDSISSIFRWSKKNKKTPNIAELLQVTVDNNKLYKNSGLIWYVMIAYSVPSISISTMVLYQSFNFVTPFHSMAGFLYITFSFNLVMLMVIVLVISQGIGLFFCKYIYRASSFFFQRENILREFKIRI